jgi:hypothetical protein
MTMGQKRVSGQEWSRAAGPSGEIGGERQAPLASHHFDRLTRVGFGMPA